mmetsp:Transcript_77358/g.153475  ORF Transcript_77358/g.153475 Transcript_77358/m.153475 type:complete len:123 (+) Transcript_77358:38-406(+)
MCAQYKEFETNPGEFCDYTRSHAQLIVDAGRKQQQLASYTIKEHQSFSCLLRPVMAVTVRCIGKVFLMLSGVLKVACLAVLAPPVATCDRNGDSAISAIDGNGDITGCLCLPSCWLAESEHM